MDKTLYHLLGLSDHANPDDIQTAYATLETELKDRSDAASIERLKVAKEAFLVLSDPTLRLRYDRSLALKRAGLSFAEPPPSMPLWPLRPASLAVVVILAALMMFWNIQTRSLEQAEAARASQERIAAQELALKQQALALQQETLRQTQQTQAEQQTRQLEAQTRAMTEMAAQVSDTASRQLDIQTEHVRSDTASQARAMELLENRQRAEIAERGLETQYRKPELELQLKEAQTSANELAKQRAIDQAERNLQSTRELHALQQEVALSQKVHDALDTPISRSNPGLDR